MSNISNKQYLNVNSPVRYVALKGINIDGEIQSPMIPREEGEWVKYSDYLALLEVAIAMEDNRLKDTDYTHGVLRDRNRLRKLLSNIIK